MGSALGETPYSLMSKGFSGVSGMGQLGVSQVVSCSKARGG